MVIWCFKFLLRFRLAGAHATERAGPHVQTNERVSEWNESPIVFRNGDSSFCRVVRREAVIGFALASRLDLMLLGFHVQ